jgi:hypothetical protein
MSSTLQQRSVFLSLSCFGLQWVKSHLQPTDNEPFYDRLPFSMNVVWGSSTRGVFERSRHNIEWGKSYSHIFKQNFVRIITDIALFKRIKNWEKSCPATRHVGAWGERMFCSYSFSTSTLDGGECSTSHPGCALPPGKGPPVHIE